MAHSQKTKDNVRRLYIEGLALKPACVAAGVSYETGRAWKAKAKEDGNDWDVARSAYQVSEQGVDALLSTMIGQMARQSVVTLRELETADLDAKQKVDLQASLADAVSKFSKSMSRINPKLGALSVSMDTLRVILEYVSKHDKALLAQLHEHLDPIGAILQDRYG